MAYIEVDNKGYISGFTGLSPLRYQWSFLTEMKNEGNQIGRIKGNWGEGGDGEEYGGGGGKEGEWGVDEEGMKAKKKKEEGISSFICLRIWQHNKQEESSKVVENVCRINLTQRKPYTQEPDKQTSTG
jgi:hypothetical protein